MHYYFWIHSQQPLLPSCSINAEHCPGVCSKRILKAYIRAICFDSNLQQLVSDAFLFVTHVTRGTRNQGVCCDAHEGCVAVKQRFILVSIHHQFPSTVFSIWIAGDTNCPWLLSSGYLSGGADGLKGGHFYLACAIHDVAPWHFINIPKPTFKLEFNDTTCITPLTAAHKHTFNICCVAAMFQLTPPHLPLTQGVQPFAIAGRTTFIYMKYGRQWVGVIFIRYVSLKK